MSSLIINLMTPGLAGIETSERVCSSVAEANSAGYIAVAIGTTTLKCLECNT